MLKFVSLLRKERKGGRGHLGYIKAQEEQASCLKLFYLLGRTDWLEQQMLPPKGLGFCPLT